MSKNKIISVEKAASLVKNDQTVMFGGFGANGAPRKIIEALKKSPVKDLVLVTNDTGFPDLGVGFLIVEKKFKKILVSHIGTNPESAKQMFAGELEVELIPQGTLAERIRAAGYGLGGVLTPTGFGTELEEGKQQIEVQGKKYLLEEPISADVALIYADKVDSMGNMMFTGSEMNFNPLMAAAADLVIVEAREVVKVGGILPNEIQTPGVLVDYIVDLGGEW